jgi:hypothetical protein
LLGCAPAPTAPVGEGTELSAERVWGAESLPDGRVTGTIWHRSR